MFIKRKLCARQVLRAEHLAVNDSDTDARMLSRSMQFWILFYTYILAEVTVDIPLSKWHPIPNPVHSLNKHLLSSILVSVINAGCFKETPLIKIPVA